MNFYNDNDSFACSWLRNLIDARLLPNGPVDDRSITDLGAVDLGSFRQCHFFAGIGGWPYALQLAGWPEDREVWTGSCPCQPFSSAGKRGGKSDERHLWPSFLKLIRECRPAVIFGEQVTSNLGRRWLAGDHGLQRVLDREAAYRVLRTAEWPSEDLHRLFSINRAEARRNAQSAKIGGSEEISEGESGEGIDPSSEAESTKEKFAVQLGRGAYTRCYRCGRLRVDGHSIQFGWREDLGQSVTGSDRSDARLFPEQCACGAPLRQRDGECVGRGQDHRDSRRDYSSEAITLSEVTGRLGIRIEAANQFEQLAGVRADLEALGYAVGAVDLCAASAGAPHIRQRLFWVADGKRQQHDWRRREELRPEFADSGGLGDAASSRRVGEVSGTESQTRHETRLLGTSQPSPWSSAEWLPCLDGKARRVEPEIQPLAAGIPNRVGLLRGSGNSIIPQVAAEFVRTFLDAQ